MSNPCIVQGSVGQRRNEIRRLLREFLIVVAIGMPMVYRRFREPDYDAYLTSGPASARLAIGATWLALVVFLGVAFYQTEGMLQTFLR